MPIGSFWAVLRADPWTQKTLETGLNPELSAKALNALQKYAVEETRLGIPVLFAEECPHGHMAIGTTVFPTSLSQASTWNAELMHRMGEAIALEARSQGPISVMVRCWILPVNPVGHVWKRLSVKILC